jgi:predicted MFS family arabinose efflux permease
MRIHKIWRWVFAAVFVLGKIFLGFAIYFYLENRQAQLQLKELKTELRQLRK